MQFNDVHSGLLIRFRNVQLQLGTARAFQFSLHSLAGTVRERGFFHRGLRFCRMHRVHKLEVWVLIELVYYVPH